MGVPGINAINYDLYNQTKGVNPFSGGIQGQPASRQPVDPQSFQGNHYKQLNDVSLIGAQKAAGFQNGLGGTSNPDNHKIFFAA